MKGDFSRDTFDPARNFSRVLMQQGRVQLDADWNEQTSILLHYLRALARDVFGAAAAPQDHAGFDIVGQHSDGLDKRWKELQQLEKEFEPVDLEALKRGVAEGDVVIWPGRFYIDGLLVENPRAQLYSKQLGLEANPEGSKGGAFADPEKAFLLCLEAWERQVSCAEDDRIREVALGGPDTCERAQVVWVVKAVDQDKATKDCKGFDPTPPSTGSLRADAKGESSDTELCVISPESKFRGLENHLYRVEVHRGGKIGAAKDYPTFKWSRENGSVVLPIRSLSGDVAVLESLGRDAHLGIAENDWVEVVDDRAVYARRAGPLAKVVAVDRDAFSVTLQAAEEGASLPTLLAEDAVRYHAILRRWDHAGDLEKDGGAIAIREQKVAADGSSEDWIPLEDGVRVGFSKKGASLQTGDYWLIPARTATGDVEWPSSRGKDGGSSNSEWRRPQGPRIYQACLGLLQVPGAGGKREWKDCRCRVQSLPCGK